MKRRFVLPLLMVLNACVPITQSDVASRAVVTDSTLPPMKSFAPQAVPRPRISNADLARDFMALSFRMESGRELIRLTRFEGPITLRVTGKPSRTLNSDLASLLSRLRNEAGINITPTREKTANITIDAVSRSAIRSVLPQAACFVAPNVSSLSEFKKARRSARTNWALLETRTKIAIFVPNDASPQEVRDCLHEELAQALGPLNDLYRLPNSVFNDDNVHTVLTGFDMMILRTTYASEFTSGMSRVEVARRLPAVLARINPAGQSLRGTRVLGTPQAYNSAIQTALGPGSSPSDRRAASDRAIGIAINAGWTDNRRAFAHYAKGRLLQSSNSAAAQQQYLLADRYYAQSRDTQLHRAYVATQLAAFALTNGEPAKAERLARAHVDAAQKSENAALLATLQLLRAEAFEAQGRLQEAKALRRESLGWARYGFGADWAVRSKLREIAALKPAPPPV